jgi:ClpP class serine protease
MGAMHGMSDRDKGLDLILHTPGGDSAATESLVDYLRAMFGTNIRAIVPQLSMSAGTMIACACKSIVMGKHSSLGPIDPQFGGLAAHAIVDEFEAAKADIAGDPNLSLLWQPILSKYPPTIVGDCQRAIDWSKTLATTWLSSGMFQASDDPEKLAENAVAYLADHNKTATHARHVSAAAAKSHGLIVEDLEADSVLQDLVLSIHHACTLTMAWGNVFKMVSNNLGTVMYSNFQV